MTAKMHTGKCFVDAVDVGERLRSLDPEKVAALAESIDAIGLQQPISVWSPDDDTLDLVAGLHRLEAFKKLRRELPDEADLRWDEIPCVFVDMDDLDRQLWEVDENLIRADLTDLERAQHTAKRAAVVKQRAQLTPKSGDNSKRGPKDKGQVKFVDDTAKATGRSKASVYKDKARGERIAEDVQKEIAGTDIEDSGVQLDALAAASHDNQRKAVEAVVSGHAKDVRDVLHKKRRTKTQIRLDDFDRAIEAVCRTCSCITWIDVPNLDSKRRSLALAALRNAGKLSRAGGGSGKPRSTSRRSAARAGQGRIDPVFQNMRGAKHQDAPRQYGDLFTGLRVAPDALSLLANREAAEGRQLDHLTAHQGIGNLIEDRVDQLGRLPAR